jgi:hypothetical protein
MKAMQHWRGREEFVMLSLQVVPNSCCGLRLQELLLDNLLDHLLLLLGMLRLHLNSLCYVVVCCSLHMAQDLLASACSCYQTPLIRYRGAATHARTHPHL